MMDTSFLTYMMVGILLFIISIYGVMFSLSDFILSIVLKSKKRSSIVKIIYLYEHSHLNQEQWE